jgi:tetratricopeptide (TPR) repeat protein
MTDKSDAYRVALGKWSTLSRPLDIVERNGALSKVPTKDPLSQAYHMAEAEVVGNIISKARAGNPVFTRLLQENPELKNSARLYFTKELFGQEAVPTIASLNTFLKTNEGPLRQLGLFNEFKDIRSSQKAAQFAVDQAKGVEKVAAKEVTEAKSLESTAKSEASRLSGRAGQAETRLSQALKTVEPIEDIAKKAAARAKPAVTKTEQKLGNITKEQKDVGKTLNDYEKLNILLRDEKDPKQIANLYNDLTERLRNEGKITPNQYQQMIGETNNILRNVKDSEEAKQKIYQFVGRTLGYGALGGAGVYGVKQFGE